MRGSAMYKLMHCYRKISEGCQSHAMIEKGVNAVYTV